jgi:predicted MPP superfamily phosphohydrolase
LRTEAKLLGAAAAAGAALYAGWIEPRRLVVRRSVLALPRWPAALDGLTIGVMSDLHAGAPYAGREAIGRWVERLNAEQPDLIALIGDFVDAHFLFGGRLAPERVAEQLADLRAPLGIVAVLGNHDWRQFGDRVWTALDGAGITVLENESVAFDAPGGRLHVAGLADMRMRRPDLRGALSGVPEDEPVILLTHDPDLFPAVPDRVALTLAGHTHGGQVAIPVLRRKVIPSRYGDRYAHGLVIEGGRRLYVSSGLGTSGAPLRALAPPELPLLELRSS